MWEAESTSAVFCFRPSPELVFSSCPIEVAVRPCRTWLPDKSMMISGPAPALPQVRAGSVKAYAVAARSRLRAAPDIPTADEAGASGFYFPYWHALWVPKGTPSNVIGKLNDAVMGALADPAVRSRLEELGHDAFPTEQQTPATLGTYHKAEIEKWWPIIKAANIKAE